MTDEDLNRWLRMSKNSIEKGITLPVVDHVVFAQIITNLLTLREENERLKGDWCRDILDGQDALEERDSQIIFLRTRLEKAELGYEMVRNENTLLVEGMRKAEKVVKAAEIASDEIGNIGFIEFDDESMVNLNEALKAYEEDKK